ncbi:MAG: M3 family oligoendopeptidase [Candidatus Kariarchaeaceae archaeon]
MVTKLEDIQWDFSKQYEGTADPKIRSILTQALNSADILQENYKNQIATGNLSPIKMKKILETVEEIQENVGPITMYSGLLRAKDNQNDEYKQFQSEIQEKTTEIRNKLVFIELELNRIEDTVFTNYLKSESLDNYSHYLTDLRKKKPYQLSEKEEQIIVLKDQYGRRAFQRLYGELVASWKFKIEIQGEQKTLTGPEMRALRMHPEPNVRRESQKQFLTKYEENELILVNIFNNLLKDYFVENTQRGYPSPITRRNLANEIDDEIVKVLETATTASYSNLVHRYYKLKKTIIGIDKLTLADIYAPLPEVTTEYDWDSGVELVLKAFEKFDPEFREITERMINEKRIDAVTGLGKSGGAFCAGASPKEWPWVLLNYTNNIRDVYTLAHELGHAIHSVLGMKQSMFNFGISAVTAEIASVFGEMIITDYILKNVQMTKEERIALISGILESHFITSHRQNMFHRWEVLAHELIKEKVMTGEEYCDIYDAELRRMFGESVEIPEEYKWEWASIPHYITHTHYVYSYNMSNLLVLALYGLYLERGETFIPQFKSMLASRCSKSPEDLFRDIGVNIRDPTFWDKGFNYLEKMIDQLEDLLE